MDTLKRGGKVVPCATFGCTRTGVYERVTQNPTAFYYSCAEHMPIEQRLEILAREHAEMVAALREIARMEEHKRREGPVSGWREYSRCMADVARALLARIEGGK